MKLGVIGTSYRTAPLEVRERLAVGEPRALLTRVCELESIEEAMLISTCNRVEVYLATPRPERAEPHIKALLAEGAGVAPDTLEPLVYCHWSAEAVRHIFRVAASLDAMVVGEAQIMGQVKRAFAEATDCGALGPLLSRCLHKAFSVAKRVRTETGIARHPASVSSVAVDLAGRIFAELADVAVLVVGAGEMAELAVRHLLSQGVSRIRVANRSSERAEELARRFNGEAVTLEALEHQLEWADVVITSTGSPQPLIDKRMLGTTMKQRKHRSLLIIDIAVPRDVDPKARSLADLYLFDVDDLEQAVAANLQARRREAKTAERLVAEEVKGFEAWLRHQDVVPLIKQLRAQYVAVARDEAMRTAQRLRLQDPDQKEAVERLADAIVNKLLHVPTTTLKKYSVAPNGIALAEATRQLFGLADGQEGAQMAGEVDRDAQPEEELS